jgi:hypothetical protein
MKRMKETTYSTQQSDATGGRQDAVIQRMAVITTQ